MASLEEENEVLLARYCMASFLPQPGQVSAKQACFRPRCFTAAEEPRAHLDADPLLTSDGPEDLDLVMPEAAACSEKQVHDDDLQQQSSLLNLPEELLWLIWELSNPSPADLCQWSLVCRRFDRIACGHVGLWVPLLPPNANDPSALLSFTSQSSDSRVNPKELYRAGRLWQYDRLCRRVSEWAQDVAKATSFDDGDGEEAEQAHVPAPTEQHHQGEKVCPLALFRESFEYLRREPLEPLHSFKTFLWDRVIKSLKLRRSPHLEMELLSTPTPLLPMLSVRFYPLPHRRPVVSYVIVWNYFPFHEPKVTAVDAEVFGLPPLPATVRATRPRNMYLGSKPSPDHLKQSLDGKMCFVQEVLDALYDFVSEHVRSIAAEPDRRSSSPSSSSCILS